MVIIVKGHLKSAFAADDEFDFSCGRCRNLNLMVDARRFLLPVIVKIIRDD